MKILTFSLAALLVASAVAALYKTTAGKQWCELSRGFSSPGA